MQPTPTIDDAMQARSTTQHHLAGILTWLYRAFDSVATWVTQLSWWKFLLFAGLTLTAAGILQEELFNGPAEEEIARAERESGRRSDASILIDESGIRFNPRTRTRTAEPAPATTPETPEVPAVPETPDTPPGPPVTSTAPSPSTGAVNISPNSASSNSTTKFTNQVDACL